MPFSLGQILGGWRRKGDAKKPARFSDKNSGMPAGKAGRGRSARSSSTSDVKSQKTSDVFPERSVSPPTIKNKSTLAWQTIIAPHISEKGGAPETGQYIFKVANGANKQIIKQAIEERYGVGVNAVRVINMPPKPRRHGQTLGEKPGFKKALISLKEGQSIAEF